MQLSYWEYKTWLSNIDFTIVGSGIVGLFTALQLRKNHPKAKILILEKGFLPQGASTKNAGFACFGSISEILSDLEHHSEEEVVQLVQKRWDGVRYMRAMLGNATIGFQQLGGHELFLDHDEEKYRNCLDEIGNVNLLLRPVFKKDVYRINTNIFDFKKIKNNYITHNLEGQIDTGKLMNALLKAVIASDIPILNTIAVESFTELAGRVAVKTGKFEFYTRKLVLATNGFASKLIDEHVLPARAQVLITKPIKDLHIKGTFHFDQGYYYFRNIDDRILFGGGRNLDLKGERTATFGTTKPVRTKLEKLLKEIILPQSTITVDRYWSGVMGVGTKKKPIVKQLSDNVYCGVRLGGMGIAIGSSVGKELADLTIEK